MPAQPVLQQLQAPPEPEPDMQALQATGAPLPVPGGRRRRRASKNRIIAGLLFAAMLAALFWVIFFTDLLTPLMAYVEPAYDFVDWVKEDPKRLMISAATVALSYIGLYTTLFGDPR